MSNAGVLTGLEHMTARRRLEFMPFAAPRVARDFDTGTPTDADAKLGYNNGFETDVPGPREIRERNRSLAVKVTYWLSR